MGRTIYLKNEELTILQAQSGLYGILNSSGKVIEDFRFILINNPSCGRLLIKVPLPDEGMGWGFIDENNANIYWLDKPYSDVRSFSENRAVVHRFYGYDRKMYGFIDVNLKEIIPLKFHGASNFKSGLASVSNEKLLDGFIDLQGNLVIPFKYNRTGDFVDELAYVANYGDRYIYKYGFINKKGEEVIPIIYDEIEDFSEGMAMIGKKNEEGYVKYGFINNTGKIVIPLIYDFATSFHNGLAIVGKRITNSWELKYGYINLKGEIEIPLKFEKAFNFSNDVASVSIDKKSYLINTKGVQISPDLDCDIIFPSSNGLFLIGKGPDQNKIGSYYANSYSSNGLFDKNWNEIIPLERGRRIQIKSCNKFHSVVSNWSTVDSNYGYNLFDNNGIKLNDKQYSLIYPSTNNCSIFVENEYTDQWKTQISDSPYGILKNGKTILDAKYNYITEFRDGFAAVKLNNKWGLANADGLITDIEFDEICLHNEKGEIYSISGHTKVLTKVLSFPKKLNFFTNGIGFVIKDGKYGLINTNGKEISPCLYDLIIPSTTKFLIYKKNGFYGFIDSNGLELTPAIYWNVFNFSEGFAACCKEGKWGFIGENGQIVIPFQYFSVGNFNQGLALVKIDNLYGYINKFNELVIKPQFIAAEDFFKDKNNNLYTYVQKWDGESSINSSYIIDDKGNIVEEIY